MRSWDRLLWGVCSVFSGDRKLLIGTGWDAEVKERRGHHGEPSRPLLFVSRQLARAWCQRKQAFYRTYPEGHVCRGWHFRPVRVRERVSAVRST